MTPDRNPLLSYPDEERIRAALSAVATKDGLQTPARVEAALLGELRRRNRRGVATRVIAAGAIAATVLAGLWFSRTPAPQVPVAQIVARQSAPETAAPVMAQAPALVPPPAPAVRRVRRPTPAPRPAPEEAGDFIPVGAWQAVEPIERGAIVRVRLPKSSLPGFGIPVSADRWNESLPADIVLAEDGSMRAIRLVSTVR